MNKRKHQISLPPTQNASLASPGDSSEDEDHVNNMQNAVRECARYILSREGSKIPIKKPDIVKHLATVCETKSQHVASVISSAEKLLKKVYGYKLVSIKGKSGLQYIVVLETECESLPSSMSDPALRTMLMAALTHIFMSGGSVKEDDLWKFLCEAGLLEENDFTGRKTFIATFTRQLYLSFTKVGDGDMAYNVFEWGQRAHEEVPKMFVLQKMAESTDGFRPPQFHGIVFDLRLFASSSCQPSCASRHSTLPEGVLHYACRDYLVRNGHLRKPPNTGESSTSKRQKVMRPPHLRIHDVSVERSGQRSG